ncbi:flagellar motor switch protein FliG [Candidatus Latescibacterota bacterium]
MNGEQVVRPVVWPTKEPEVPPKPPVAAEKDAQAQQAPAKTPVQPAPAMPRLPAGVEQDSTHAHVWANAPAAAAVVRGMIHGAHDVPTEGPLAGMSARQEVAALMAGLGVEVGGMVVRLLRDDGDIRWVAGAIAEEPEVKHSVAMHALEVLRQRLEAGDYLEKGGPELASELLGRAVGGYRARRMLQPGSEGEEGGFAILQNVAPEQVAPFISHEHPQTIAITLSQLNPAQASSILAQLPQRMQSDVAYRIATMENVTPAVLFEIEEALEASLQDILSGNNQDVGGPKVVADMLNMTGSSVEKNVLDHMDGRDPEVAEAVRNLMFTFADISKLTDRELQVLLQEVDQKHVAIALKAAEEELKDKVLGNMSERVRTSITEQMEHLGPMRLSEVEEIQLRIVQQVRQLEEQGELTIVRGDADDTFV